ncbi:MAG: YitT family protein [Bacteroidetes bacterium]|nr:YitT family protein [Bacteroidota bacterium]
MKPFFRRLLITNALKQNQSKLHRITKQEIERVERNFKITSKRYIKDFVLITAGIFSASFGFKGFLLTNHFIDGGATGISLLISALTNVSLSTLIICINVPFVLLAYHVIGRSFAIKTTLAIAGLASCLAFVEFPNITNDNLLVAVFGGFFLGAGIGLAVRGGAVIDGTEVLAIFLSRKLGTSIGDIIIVINVIIFSAAAYLLGVEISMYSMITYLAASKTLDFIVEGIEEYTGVTIISERAEEIRQMIINEMERGVTVYTGKKGYGKRGETNEIEIIYTVVTRLELNKLNMEIEKIDNRAFVVMNSVKDTIGGMIKKRPLNH